MNNTGYVKNTPCGQDECELCTPESITLHSLADSEGNTDLAEAIVGTFEYYFGEVTMAEAIQQAVADGFVERIGETIHLTPLGFERMEVLDALEGVSTEIAP